MFKPFNQKSIIFIFVLLALLLMACLGIYYVPHGTARVNIHNDMALLDTPEFMQWQQQGTFASFTIDSKLGVEKDSLAIKAYVYDHTKLVNTIDIGYVYGQSTNQAVTVQLYRSEKEGFSLASMGAGMSYSSEPFLMNLKEMPGYGLTVNPKVDVKSTDKEIVVAVYTIGSTIRHIEGKIFKENSNLPFAENVMTIIFTVQYKESY